MCQKECHGTRLRQNGTHCCARVSNYFFLLSTCFLGLGSISPYISSPYSTLHFIAQKIKLAKIIPLIIHGRQLLLLPGKDGMFFVYDRSAARIFFENRYAFSKKPRFTSAELV